MEQKSQPSYDPIANARLAAIVDSSFDAIVSKDLDSRITSWNFAAEQMFGYTAEEAIGQSILFLIPERLHSEEADIIARIRSGERVESFDTIRMRKDGSLIHVSITVSPIKDADGVIVGASKIARDISSAKEAERRIKTLLREINHRVKNQFAVILSLIRETSRHAVSPQSFVDQVQDRIIALSRSHDLLVDEDWSGVSLFALIQGHLSMFAHEEQISLSGSPIVLAPIAVQPLGMAIHELGTNAAKYGALMGTNGRVEISWKMQDGPGGERELTLTWDEKFPIIPADSQREASRRGFGTTVLERIVPLSVGGKSTLERGSDHVRWTLIAPFKEIAAQHRIGDDREDEPLNLALVNLGEAEIAP